MAVRTAAVWHLRFDGPSIAAEGAGTRLPQIPEATAWVYPMTASKADNPAGTDSSTDLNGVDILLVEDSWHVGQAMKRLLHLMGAKVAGPAATTAEAERLLSEHAPDVAIVDISLRGGERAFNLIDRLNEQGVRVIVISGYAEIPPASGKAMAFLQKPVSEAELLAALRPLIAQRAAR